MFLFAICAPLQAVAINFDGLIQPAVIGMAHDVRHGFVHRSYDGPVCSAENPTMSIKGSSAPRITQSKVGWLRSSSFSRKVRPIFVDFFMPRSCFAATGVMFGPQFFIWQRPRVHVMPGLWQRNIVLLWEQWNSLQAGFSSTGTFACAVFAIVITSDDLTVRRTKSQRQECLCYFGRPLTGRQSPWPWRAAAPPSSPQKPANRGIAARQTAPAPGKGVLQ